MCTLAWTLETTRPAAFVLLLVFLPIAWYFHRSLVDLTREQRIGSLVTRCTILALLILAAAGINLIQDDTRQFTVFLVDRSDSLDETAHAAAQKFIAESVKSMRAGDEARIVEFAASAMPPYKPGEPPPAGQLDRGHTDIAHALSA